jgi:putative transposase
VPAARDTALVVLRLAPQVAAETATAARRRTLAEHIRRVFDAARGAYGCRRVAAQRNRDGHPCSVGLVADLMRELGLQACQPRAYKRTTVPGQAPVTSPDLIGREFTADTPGQRLVGDITSWLGRRVAPGPAAWSARVLLEPLAE